MHYRPRTLVLNNLEYDHADIYPDLAAIQTQFHQLLRSVPGNGLIVAPSQDEHLDAVLAQGVWTPICRFGSEPPRRTLSEDTGEWWHAEDAESDGSRFTVVLNDQPQGELAWGMIGEHNVRNALAAIAACRHAGVAPGVAIEALAQFSGVKRRLELIADRDGIRVYDDFAHHPTAIRTTLQGLRNRVGNEEILAVVEPRSHTMSLGTLRQDLSTCCSAADSVFWFRGENIRWDLSEVVNDSVIPARLFDDLDKLMQAIASHGKRPCHVVIMSNGAFGGIYDKLPRLLATS